MHRKRITTLLLFLIALSLAGCAGLAERSTAEKAGHAEVLAQEIYFGGGFPDAPKSVVGDGAMATLYLNGENRLVFRTGNESTLLDEDISGKGMGKTPSLYGEGSNLYAVWWAKTPPKGDKFLYFKASYDRGKTFEPTRIINSGNGVLDYSFASDGKGMVAFAYYDERSGHYEIYANVSRDYGKTWLERDVRIDAVKDIPKEKDESVTDFAVEPKIVIDGRAIIITWKERDSKRKVFSLKCRVSRDGGVSWEPEKLLRESATIVASSDNLIFHKGIIYYFGHENGAGIIGFRSPDHGATWESISALPGTEDAVNSQLRVVGKDDYLYAVYTREKGDEKVKVYSGAFSCPEGKWRPAVRLSTSESDLTKAFNPAIAVLRDGTVVAAWEDYRTIRPNIFINVSTDNGKTWLDSPRSIEPRGEYSSRIPALSVDSDRLYVFFQRFRDDFKKKLDYLCREFPAVKAEDLRALDSAKPVSLNVREEQLRKRVNGYWEQRIKRHYLEDYAYYDPFFRAQIPGKEYEKFQGNFIYNKAEIEGVKIEGNIAAVKMKINFELMETEIAGRKIAIAPRDDTFTEEWIWVYDNWYRLWKSSFGRTYAEY